MLNRPLTREEAVQRAKLLEVSSYDIELDLTGCDGAVDTFGTRTRIAFSCRVPGSSTFAEFRSTAPAEAFLNSQSVPVVDGRIALDKLQSENELLIHGRGDYSTSGEGLHRAVDPADGAVYIYSMCFLHEASRVFGCFDQPDLKAVMRLQVTAPSGWAVISNSPLEGAENGLFAATPRLPTYLLALAAGPYVSVHDSWRSSDEQTEIPLGLYCRKSLERHLESEELFEVTRSGLDFFTKTFGVPMPFAKYDQLFAPEFNAGAMENPGLVMHMDELVFRSAVTDDEREMRALIVLHEMAHMWFGDLVSMRWWDDLWLNESFATYCGYLATAEATRHREAWTTFCVAEKANARAADVRPSSHPVSSRAADTDRALLNFDAISYNKGASLLQQLVAFVGRDSFFDGIRQYFLEHAWGSTDLADLLRALERSGGRDLKEWGDQHLKSAGLPRLHPEVTTDSGGNIASLVIEQEGAESRQRLGVGAYIVRGDSLVLARQAEVEVMGSQVLVDGFAGDPVPDYLLLNHGDLAYANVELDHRSLRTLRSVGVNALDASLARGLTWGALRDMVYEARLPAADFVDLAVDAVSGETHMGVLARVIEWADTVTRLYTPVDRVDDLRAKLADACWSAAEAAHPGSSQELALVRAHAALATTSQQLNGLAARLDGPPVQNGLAIDADLRWQLLTRLVAAGQRGGADIDAEFARDSTAFGHHRSAEARAALPSPEAKERAWMVATVRESTTNRMVYSACHGFWQSDQLDVCRPYVSRFFEELDRVWRECDVELAHIVTQHLFPAVLVEPSTLTYTDEHLSRPNLPAGQRRILRDRRFDLIQAMAAREAASSF